jgi:hypothetical protein
MTRVRSVFVLAAGSLMLACADGHEAKPVTAGVTEPLLNGEKFTDAASMQASVVLISMTAAVPKGKPGIGSGILLNKKTADGHSIVLTARHVVDRAQLPEGLFIWNQNTIKVTQGNASAPQRKTTGLARPPYFYTVGDGAPDVAILFLDSDLAAPGTQLAELDCEDHEPRDVVCESANRHSLNSGKLVTEGDQMNLATFSPTLFQTSGPGVVTYSHNETQDVEQGDSGGGCFDVNNGKLTAIIDAMFRSLGGQQLNPDFFGTKPGSETLFAAKIAPLCKWIDAATAPDHKIAFETQIGDGDAVEDLVTIAQLAGDTHTLSIDRSLYTDQSFEVTIPADANLRAGAVGSFTGGKPSLVLANAGALTGASFNGGLAPLIAGAPSTDYVALSKARVNSDKVDDLVARRSDGTLDVFTGGTSGLQFSSAITPVAMKLDRDRLPDFVWFNGATLSSFSTVGQDAAAPGLTSRTLIPSSLSAIKAVPGRFRDASLEIPGDENKGIQDLIVLSSTATGGAVVPCKSTGFGLACSEALDWQNKNNRIATDIQVADVDGDPFDDLIVTYANQDTDPRTYLGSKDGFAIFGFAARHAGNADVDGNGNADSIILNSDPDTVVGKPSGNVSLSVRRDDGTVVGPVTFAIPYVEPVAAVAANFNGDTGVATIANGDANGPAVQDLAILSGGRIFALISNGDGTFTVNTPTQSTGYVSIDSGDVNGDGLDDLEATRADGSVTVFAGVSGSGQGLQAVGQNFTGIPTPESNDGKMVVLSGLGVDTVAATDARFKLTVGPNDTDALSKLTVQIFDGINEGLHQFDRETKILKTCYQLSADPCGDGSLGNCNGATRPKVRLKTVSSDTLNDDVWDTIFDGPHSPDASLTGNGTAPFTYELYVYLSQDCNTLPTAGSTISVKTADAFKVRSNAMVSHPAGELSIIGSDSDGPFGIPDQPYMRDTNYDGTFSLPISVGPSAVEIQLKEADADNTQDATPGVSLGANADISYQLLRPDGTPASMVGAENTTPTILVTNPSGNNDGLANGDVETRIASISTPTPGMWTWKWQKVMASNAIHLFGPFGSPTTHEVLGAMRARPTTSTVEQSYFWSSTSELSSQLPIVLGAETPDGSLDGHSVRVTTVQDATTILANTDNTQQGELEKQLLVAKLNAGRSSGLGEDINGALVYGTVTSVRTVIQGADEIVAGSTASPDDTHVARFATMLSSVNLGEITYQDPGVPFSDAPMADDDGDQILNVKDNCPSIANPMQEDTRRDGIGDACRATPIAECVLGRAADRYDAFFSYRNPLTFRSIPIGNRNKVETNTDLLDVHQPTELAGGTVAGFSVPFDGTTAIRWTLDGTMAEVNSGSPRCSGSQLARVDFAQRVAAFGVESVTIGDYASIIASGGLPTVVSNGDVELGADVVVGDVLARGQTRIGSKALVRGSIVTGNGQVQRPGAVVQGFSKDGAALHEHSIEWLADAPTTAAAVELGSGDALHLAPGDYGAVAVPAGATLTLDGGTYRFASLFVAKGGTLVVPPGEVVVHVLGALSHLGETRLSDATSHVTLGYFGDDSAHIAAQFRGTVVAPNAELVIGSARNVSFAGAFFARRLTVLPGTIVEFAAF